MLFNVLIHILKDKNNRKIEILKAIKQMNVKSSYLQALKSTEGIKQQIGKQPDASLSEIENNTEPYKQRKIWALNAAKLFFTETTF